MAGGSVKKHCILIADDSEMNRAILEDMLGSEYDILEAENGEQALETIREHEHEISLILLDIVMPGKNGFDVLAEMNNRQWIEDIPVIMISAESNADNIEKAYKLGASDFISRPFDTVIVHHRVVNTILLYAKQRNLMNLVADQIYERELSNSLMIDILSHIVEFRNGESGLHVRHVNLLTAMFLGYLTQNSEKYHFSEAEIALISTASALHDIGKIAVDEAILNKPGRLTNEEFEIMKTHTSIGAQMLRDLPIHEDEPLVKVAYDICRWHHERYDGRGYPDGIKGDDIPISAQVVALADVYDALTSERVYKPPFTHKKAVEMILEGQCGAFDPELMDCLRALADGIQEELQGDTQERAQQRGIRRVADELLHHKGLNASERTLRLLEHERMKYNFFASLTDEIQFEFTVYPPMLSISAQAASRLGLPEIVMDPAKDQRVRAMMEQESWEELVKTVQKATPEKPIVSYECRCCYRGEWRWTRIIARGIWGQENEVPVFTGVIGKAIDVHDSQMKLSRLKQMASHDPMTGLLNHRTARENITDKMKDFPENKYALALLDLDHFKDANDTYGHAFGDQVLIHVANKLQHSVRGGDIAARIGGDEFLVFLEYTQGLEPIIHRIYNSLNGDRVGDFTIQISMGIGRSEEMGTDYTALFNAADHALYAVKRGGRGSYRFYDSSMDKVLSAITPIDGEEDADGPETEKEE